MAEGGADGDALGWLLSSFDAARIARWSLAKLRRPGDKRHQSKTLKRRVRKEKNTKSAKKANDQRLATASLHFCQLFFQKLLVVKIGVVAVLGDEFVVGAQFDDASAMQHGDPVGVSNG